MKKTLATILLTLLIALPCFGAPPVPIQPGGSFLGGTLTSELITAASATGGAGFNLPHGTAPSSPANGDVWTTTAGIYVRVNGSTVGPLIATSTGASISGTPAQYQWGEWVNATTIKGTAVTASKVVCTDANGSPVACTNSFTFPAIAAAGDVIVGSGAGAATVITKGANSSIFGVNSAGTLGFYTSILIDNSAAQFKDATDATKLWTISPVNFGTGVDFTFSPYVASDLSWSPTISAAGISTGVLFVEVDGHTDSTNLTAANVSRTFINSYDRAGAATLTLPAAAAGYSFVAIVGTQHNSLWKIQRAGSDTIYWDSGGTLTAGKTYFGETNQAVGSRVSCSTFRTGASAYSWLCGVVSGTWTTD